MITQYLLAAREWLESTTRANARFPKPEVIFGLRELLTEHDAVKLIVLCSDCRQVLIQGVCEPCSQKRCDNVPRSAIGYD